jgi:leucyl aminopeptidase (aminopeptidase T)
MDAAADAAADCLGLSEEDRVAIVFNPPQREIADALAVAARTRGASVSRVGFRSVTRHGEEPPAEVASALLQSSAAFAVTTHSLSHTYARLEASAGGTRIASMPELDAHTFARTLPIDYDVLREMAALVADGLSSAVSCRITSAKGTDLCLSLAERTAHIDDGDLRRSGAFGNLPAGEAYIAPLEKTAEGWLVIDATMAGYGALAETLKLRIANGRIVAACGAASEWLLQTLDAGGPDGRAVAELGIGVNPNAAICGHNIVDEKALGTAHLAFGRNRSFGGRNDADVHIDAVLREPTIELDGHTLLKDGRLQTPGAT